MGLTKQYLRFVSGGNVNLIADSKCNVIFVTLENQIGRFVAAGACEHVYVWDLRLGEKVQVLSGEKANVTCLAASPNKRQIAAGYDDGTIKTFDLKSSENIATFVGHRSEITCMAYDELGQRLISGSKDTDIIIWDIIAENGISRLQGHKGVITSVSFMKNNIAISSCTDATLKFWDLDNNHNFETLSYRSEIWSFTLIGNYLIFGSSSPDLVVNKISWKDDDLTCPLQCVKFGTIVRAGKGRVQNLITEGDVLCCYGNDNTVEIFNFLSDSAAETIKKQFRRLNPVKVSNKVKSAALVMGRGGELRVCASLNNNSIELYSMKIDDKSEDPDLLKQLISHGHRSEVRAVCFSSDNLAFATVSGESIKVWSRTTQKCICTIEGEYSLCVIFVPGDRHLIVGTKSGKLQIVDIAAAEIAIEFDAHDSKEVWSVALLPSLKGVVSGGADATVKFWDFELADPDKESESRAKVLTLKPHKLLKLDQTVMCVRVSPNNKYVAVALLDSTVKIFWHDTLKFYHSLYGHNLPVLSMDISSDSTLIVTGSADRNIKIWGMDFADCHKSLFAHDDTVTGVAFVPKTHYFFTCGKDGKVKEWDADNFEKIITLPGHAGQAHGCAVSSNGTYLASCGSDKVVRMYERSQEILVLEDEAEEERAKEDELVTGDTTAVQGQKTQALPSRKTVNAEKAAELIIECLDLCEEYEESCANVVPPNPMPPLPLLMQTYKCQNVNEYFIETFKRVRACDFDEALYLLPFSTACKILKILPKLLQSDYQAEMIIKVGLSLIEAHNKPITASKDLLPQIEEIHRLALERISTIRDMVGYNLYALEYEQRENEQKEGILLFQDAKKKAKNRSKQVKRRAIALM
ncbi:WD repeat-containing protein 3 [Trichogramma pretiosum]|uniref:WD repeat-containing protein 3 n=1 Tax=Trichogramma pretiosum TaxID=7493 RepID=UPI0006C95CCF|nr:WD repeat-containing protein 3 [Trichogramma pretiosum]